MYLFFVNDQAQAGLGVCDKCMCSEIRINIPLKPILTSNKIQMDSKNGGDSKKNKIS